MMVVSVSVSSSVMIEMMVFSIVYVLKVCGMVRLKYFFIS